jgi:alkyl sulfatase BDS1-like metallo-beta-lactamase superfamily hydrolase
LHWTYDADAKMTLSKTVLDNIQLDQTTLKDAVAAGHVKVEGREAAVAEFLGLLDTYPFWFNIVTP